MIDRRKLTAVFVAGVSVLAICAPALAQTAASAPVGQAAAEPAATDQASTDQIVVTGSRTTKNGDNSPTPVTVISTETLSSVRPTSLTESIQVMPVFSGSRGQTSNPSATGGTGGGNGTAAQLNLRNVGSNRNLVLMDGRRVPPTSFTSIVDADVIPQLLIKRVDVVTGGVSAVYGSDAVSGVVNFVTDTTFKGFKVQGQVGISQLGDDPSQELGAVWGTGVGERGHFEISYEYRNDAGLSRRSDRDWLRQPTVVGNGTTIPYFSIVDSRLSAQPFGGRITCTGACAINGQYFASNGVLSPFANGTVYTGSTTQSGGAGGYLDNSLKASQRMNQVYARFDYELTDSIKAFATASGNFKNNVFYGDDLLLSAITLSKANGFLSPAYQAQIPTATFTYNQMFNQNARLRQEADSRQLIGTAGLEGKIGGNWSWNADFVHGESRLKTVLTNNPNLQHLSAALDAVTNSAGQTVCYASTQAATAAAYANCVPLNVFGPSAASAAAIDYVLDTTHYVATTKQDDAVASLAGSPFSTWAGPVNVALSAEWRRQTFQSSSDGQPTQIADCTNLRFNCVATGNQTLLLRNSFSSSPKVSQTVREASIEATVPLLRELPLVQAFDINGAARYTKYNTVGSYATWKLGADWAVFDGLRLRGTISRDIRAPTLFDLTSPSTVNTDNFVDQRTGVTRQLTQLNVSNPNLTAEIGHTKTVGVVVKPRFIPGFSLAVDYYKITIDNAITQVQGSQTIIQNACNISGIALYCSLIPRDAAGNILNFITKPINLAQIKTAGVDVELNYQGRLFGRPFAIRGLAAYQPHIRYIQPGVPTIDQGGVAFGASGISAAPSVRITGFFTYMVSSKLRIDILEKWRNSLKLSGDPTLAFAPGDNHMAPFGQTSLNVALDVTPRVQFFINIQNLFNATPPVGNSPGTASTPGKWGGFALTDDVVGRYFTTGFKAHF